MKTAAERRQPQQSPAEWARDVREKLQPTTVSLRNYGGGKLAIVSQVKCQLTSDREAIETVVQVQKGAAEDLLLGTDVLSRLGFSLVNTPKNGHPKDLLQGGGEQPSTKHRSTRTECEANSLLQLPAEDGDASPPVVSAPPNTTATVRLIHAARIPAQHYKLVHVTIDSPKPGLGTCLFEPEIPTLGQQGISAADALVELNPKQNKATLVLANHGVEPVLLDEDEILGTLHPATVLETTLEQKGQVAAISTTTDSVRVAEVMEALEGHTVELKSGETDQLQALITEYHQLFALTTAELGRTSFVTHTINTGNHPPIKQAPRRVPFSLRGTVDRLIDDMLNQGVITHSASTWASPVVLVAKKDGSTRFCVDYRKLNSITKQDVYPLPRIDDSLDLLAGTQYFTSLDLASGYWQVGMEGGSQEKTAFTTHRGLYEFSFWTV